MVKRVGKYIKDISSGFLKIKKKSMPVYVIIILLQP